jgi:hypothetical protein
MSLTVNPASLSTTHLLSGVPHAITGASGTEKNTQRLRFALQLHQAITQNDGV